MNSQLEDVVEYEPVNNTDNMEEHSAGFQCSSYKNGIGETDVPRRKRRRISVKVDTDWVDHILQGYYDEMDLLGVPYTAMEDAYGHDNEDNTDEEQENVEHGDEDDEDEESEDGVEQDKNEEEEEERSEDEEDENVDNEDEGDTNYLFSPYFKSAQADDSMCF